MMGFSLSELYSRHRLRMQAPGQRLALALADQLPVLSRSKARQAVVAGLVQVAGQVQSDPTWCLPEQIVSVQLDLSQGLRAPLRSKRGGRSGRPFTVLYEDDSLVVIDKACGVLSAPYERDVHGHIPELLRQHFRKRGYRVPYIGVVHRLDKETSGCICYALTRKAQELLGAQFAGQSAQRHYRCLVLGQPKQDQDILRGKLGRGYDGRRWVVSDHQPGKPAITHFQVVKRFAAGSELTVQLETGRTHQIRIHLSAIGCPVAGDLVYDRQARARVRGRPRAPRLMLHAEELALDHPVTGERLVLQAPVPSEFEAFRRRLSGR
jgi:23S rRNA pseudouridine1911/1915/1917 synthase